MDRKVDLAVHNYHILLDTFSDSEMFKLWRLVELKQVAVVEHSALSAHLEMWLKEKLGYGKLGPIVLESEKRFAAAQQRSPNEG